MVLNDFISIFYTAYIYFNASNNVNYPFLLHGLYIDKRDAEIK